MNTANLISLTTPRGSVSQIQIGSKVISINKPYEELEYIQSSGTQYINTGFKPTYQTRVVADFQLTSAFSSFRSIFGTRASTSATDSKRYLFNNSASKTLRSDYFGSGANQSTTITSETTRMTVDKNKNITTVDGKTLTNTAVSSGTATYNLYLFCMNNAGSTGYFSTMKLYSCQIYDNDVLVRDFIPVLWNETGEYGLYDKVNKEFYSNAGSGSFTGA